MTLQCHKPRPTLEPEHRPELSASRTLDVVVADLSAVTVLIERTCAAATIEPCRSHIVLTNWHVGLARVQSVSGMVVSPDRDDRDPG
ncbi:protein of unknown function [Paraburkholderia kururiensis]